MRKGALQAVENFTSFLENNLSNFSFVKIFDKKCFSVATWGYSMSPVTIAIFDDQPLMVEAIKLFLSRNPENRVIAAGASATDIYNICCTKKPRIAIVELSLS